jgi:hypothetical protein
MEKCKTPLELHRFLEKELNPATAERISEHLKSCARCSERLADLARTRALIESALATEAGYRDTSEEIMNRAFGGEKLRAPRGRFRIFLKRAVIGAAACVALLVISTALFVRIYFDRTFSHELNEMVIRCTAGIEARSGEGDWQALRVGDSLRKATQIRMPEKKRSFMSFDGVRLLADGVAELATSGPRKFSFRSGEMVVASAERKTPVEIDLGVAIIRANGGVLRIERKGGHASLGVASGTVEIILPDGKSHNLVEGQTASFGAGGGESGFKLARGEVVNPFERMKVSPIERTRQRFAKVISKYLPDIYAAGHLRDGDILDMWDSPEAMYRFVSNAPVPYTSLKLARGGERTLGEYYESLFTPSNRSLSMGRQKLVPLPPGKAAAQFAWSHDGSMLSYAEFNPADWPTIIKVVRLDDLENPWVVSQHYDTVLPMFSSAWSPDDRHVLFQVTDDIMVSEYGWLWNGPYKIKIGPVDPSEGPLRDFKSPFYDISLPLPIPVGKTISPHVFKAPWGNAVTCSNWGNLGYIPVEDDGQAVEGAPGFFITDFNPRDLFTMGGGFSPSGSMFDFTAVADLNFSGGMNSYILQDVEDILDGFTAPPRSLDDPRLRRVAPSNNMQVSGGFSFDESLHFYHEDMNGAFNPMMPTDISRCDFDFFYTDALPGGSGEPVQIRAPGNQMFTVLSPEGNRLAYCHYEFGDNRRVISYEFRIISFDVEVDIDIDLGGILIDNSGTNLIVPPGTLEENFGVVMSTPFSIGEEAELTEGDETFFAMRLIDAQGLDNPQFREPMTLTIRYTDDEVYGLDEGMLEIYYYDETDPDAPVWVALGGTVYPEHNEITVEIRHFSKFSVGGRPADPASRR